MVSCKAFDYIFSIPYSSSEFNVANVMHAVAREVKQVAPGEFKGVLIVRGEDIDGVLPKYAKALHAPIVDGSDLDTVYRVMRDSPVIVHVQTTTLNDMVTICRIADMYARPTYVLETTIINPTKLMSSVYRTPNLDILSYKTSRGPATTRFRRKTDVTICPTTKHVLALSSAKGKLALAPKFEFPYALADNTFMDIRISVDLVDKSYGVYLTVERDGRTILSRTETGKNSCNGAHISAVIRAYLSGKSTGELTDEEYGVIVALNHKMVMWDYCKKRYVFVGETSLLNELRNRGVNDAKRCA